LFNAEFKSLRLLSLLLAVLCAGCTAATDDVMIDGKIRRMRRSISSQFEWAVQSFETGAYGDAIQRFERLRKEGSEVREYDLISFYLGMSHYKLGEPNKAAQELEAFLRSGTQRQESQDARLTLLLVYEKLERWKDSASLAAETNKLSLFHYNRALLKLLWARALAEQGEMQGAQVELEETVAYLDKVGDDEKAMPYFSNPDQDLWGRYHFSSVLLEARDCSLSQPKEIQKKKRLYAPWLDSVADCLRKTLTHSGQELFGKENIWGDLAEEELRNAFDAFAQKIKTQLAREAPVLANHQKLLKMSREAFYRILGTADEQVKNLKNQALALQHLERLRKQLDRLLVGFSASS